MPILPGPADVLIAVDAPLAGDGSGPAPVSIPAATNATAGHATAAQIAALEGAVAAQLTGDQFDAVNGANAPDAGNPFATMADVGGGGAPMEVLYFGASDTSTAAAGAQRLQPGGALIPSVLATDNNKCGFRVSRAGRFRNLRVGCLTDPTDTQTFRAIKNGTSIASGIVCTLDVGTSTASDLDAGHFDDLAVGDYISIGSTASGVSVGALNVSATLEFTPS